MENLNAEKVKVALDWCSKLRLCVDCPMRAEGYFSHSGNACRQALMANALALIESQEQRIKELAEENERLRASHTDRSEQKNHLHIIVDGKETGTWDGIIYVFCEERAKRIILTASGDQSDRFLSLDDCLDEIGCKETESAIVIIEDSLHGDVYRFGNYADRSWYKVGETVGYA